MLLLFEGVLLRGVQIAFKTCQPGCTFSVHVIMCEYLRQNVDSPVQWKVINYPCKVSFFCISQEESPQGKQIADCFVCIEEMGEVGGGI